MRYLEALISDLPAIMTLRYAVRENPLNTPGLVTDCEHFRTDRIVSIKGARLNV